MHGVELPVGVVTGVDNRALDGAGQHVAEYHTWRLPSS
jgi:hypothetical protein